MARHRGSSAAAGAGAGGTNKPRPVGSRDTHTVHLYAVDEVLSSMQKAIRRGLVADACYWAAELEVSGLARATMDRLMTVATEDVSLGHVDVPCLVLGEHRTFQHHHEPGRRAQARDVLLRCAARLAMLPKCRLPCTSAAAVTSLLQRHVDQRSPWLGHSVPMLLRSFAKCARRARESATCAAASEAEREQRRSECGEAEELALCILQRLWIEPAPATAAMSPATMDSLATQGTAAAEVPHASRWEQEMWDAVRALKPTYSVTARNIKALYALSHGHGCKAHRYCLFHALFLFTREHACVATSVVGVDASRWAGAGAGVTPTLCVAREIGHVLDEDGASLFPTAPLPPVDWIVERVQRAGLEGRHWRGVPHYAIDKHTGRGKGGRGEDASHVWGLDTRRFLGAPLLGWPADELARSHGPGRRWPRHCGLLPRDDDKGGLLSSAGKGEATGPGYDRDDLTLCMQFYDQGTLVLGGVCPPPGVCVCAGKPASAAAAAREQRVLPVSTSHDESEHRRVTALLSCAGDDPYQPVARHFYLQLERQLGSREAKAASLWPEQWTVIGRMMKQALDASGRPVAGSAGAGAGAGAGDGPKASRRAGGGDGGGGGSGGCVQLQSEAEFPTLAAAVGGCTAPLPGAGDVDGKSVAGSAAVKKASTGRTPSDPAAEVGGGSQKKAAKSGKRRSRVQGAWS